MIMYLDGYVEMNIKKQQYKDFIILYYIIKCCLVRYYCFYLHM